MLKPREIREKFKNRGKSDFGNYEKSIEYHQKALKINQHVGNKRSEGKNLGNLGMVYQNLGLH